MSTLFNGDNSDSDAELKVNTDYAKNYNSWRQKEELNKLKTKYGDINEDETSDDNSESESSTEEENELTQQFDKDFYKTLALLKNKDPKIYNQDVTFFDGTNKAQEFINEKKKQKTKDEPIFLRDYERKIIIEKEGKLSDSEDEGALKKNKKETEKITYIQEQKQLKESFKVALNEVEEEDDFLISKTKSESEKQKEEADYIEWLKGHEANINKNEQEALKPLRDCWSNPNLDANEKFLRDYILNNKYLDKDYAESDENEEEAGAIHDSDENLSEDEKNIERQEEFEHKYNFRFEEPDQEFIKRYPRTIENSLRRKDTRRVQKRAEVKKRKEEEKMKKKEELKQLKALERKELEEKIAKCKEVSGYDVQFNDIDLDGDFDPVEHDRKMNQIFNDDYYAASEEDAKPKFPEIDEELEIEDTWDDYDPNAENYVDEGGYDEPHCEDLDFNMDADYDPSKKVQDEMKSSTGRKRKRKSKFAELIAKEKPKFDPEQYKHYHEYFDKYYSLDYEDTIGDIKCRFGYKEVVPNDYGLSIEEILSADDKELNKWCSLKRALQIKPDFKELNDVQMYKQKAKNEALKKKILRSLYTDPVEEGEGDEKEAKNIEGEYSETKKKRRKKKKKAQQSEDDKFDKDENLNTNTDAMPKESDGSLRPEKRKHVEDQQPMKKKRKINNLKESTDFIENKTHEEKEISEPINKKSSTQQNINDQHQNECSVKQSKKTKLKEKMKKKKKFDKTKMKNSKTDINSDIASLDPNRLKMYGINPKKLKNKLKYGKKEQ